MAYGETLVLHHIEPTWETGFDSDYLLRVVDHLQRANYDRVIVTTLEGTRHTAFSRYSDKYKWEFSSLSAALSRHVVIEEDWSYGWEQPEEYYGFQPGEIIRFSGGHGDAYLYEWIRDLAPYSGRLKLAGGYVGECLYDLQRTFDHLNIRFKTIGKLVY